MGAYWYVSRGGDVWLLRNDGLWGMSFQFRARNDSLVGTRWIGTDVPGARPEPAVAVRTASCPRRMLHRPDPPRPARRTHGVRTASGRPR
ncbi:hypothetical protein [Longimicrobium terrae]|uniref:Uncharacterized protein n=1 Tax=Longimicrobium terrae TaxID=1639882 RepID=A0A841GZ23_9BACT|nr:hypothetical protein [Longimicrobium terrae]MBB4636435.1 hypothetical protein [Longimicrobium terrae]MBB6071041.1 hypothetical protein [Longimicrobium terrae]NNC29062.1 hypothetical protein [Longimicrobium terrae]